MADEAQQELANLPTAIEYQGVWIRFVSLLIDSIIIIILIGIIDGFCLIQMELISWKSLTPLN